MVQESLDDPDEAFNIHVYGIFLVYLIQLGI